jgi:hypothetical protein
VTDNRHHVNVRIDRRLPSTDAMSVGDSGQCLEGRRTKLSVLRRRSARPLPRRQTCCMTAADPNLERLLKAERLALERYERLRGYPGDVQEVALALWTEATEAVREYRSTHP